MLLRVHTVVGGQTEEEIPEDTHAHLSQNPCECEAHCGVLLYTGHMGVQRCELQGGVPWVLILLTHKLPCQELW